jgi:hypothetical protein
MSESTLHFLGTALFTEAKRIQAALKERGVIVTLINNPDAPAAAGKPQKIEMYVEEEAVPQVAEFFRQEKARDLGGLEIQPELLDEVFDPEKDTARCPACSEVFSTRLTECPGCGLGFSGEEASCGTSCGDGPKE